MPVFYEAGTPYPIRSMVAVKVAYYNASNVATIARINGLWPTLPLVTHSRIAREQIAYNGNSHLLLDGGELCGGTKIYSDILRWLDQACRFNNPSQPFLPLQVGDMRTIKDSPVLCLNYHRALLAFDLYPRAQQTWIRLAMWRSSLNEPLPDPNWVYEVWAELSSYDSEYVRRTIQAAASKWKSNCLSAEQLKTIAEIKEEIPDLWNLLLRNMDKEHGQGHADCFVKELEGDSALQQANLDEEMAVSLDGLDETHRKACTIGCDLERSR